MEPSVANPDLVPTLTFLVWWISTVRRDTGRD